MSEVKGREEQEVPLKVESGSFVLLDYTIKVKETGELVETTLEEEAKASGLTGARKVYEPRLVIPGKGFILRAIEEELVGMKEGETKAFEVPPERAFGQRDPSKVKIIPERKLRDSDVPLVVGARVSVDGKEGIIRSVGSGRVQVDFNPYLAGKNLLCNVSIRKIVTDDIEKVRYLIRERIPEAEVDKFKIDKSDGLLSIILPQDVYLTAGLQMSKKILANDIHQNIQGIQKVRFIEEYSKE